MNVVNYSTAAVAQHTISCVLYILEKLRYYDDYVKTGIYASQPRFSHFGLPYYELDGKTWGIVGTVSYTHLDVYKRQTYMFRAKRSATIC